MRDRSLRASPSFVLAAVGFAVFVAADDLAVVTTMLRPIVNDLGLTLPEGLDDAAWIVNVYLIAFITVMPLAGRLSDVIGRRRTFVGAYGIFVVGTIVIPLAGSLPVFLTGRALTAIGGGAMVPVALAVVGDVYPEERRGRALGTLGAIETLGWVWGPLYGAMLVRFLSWHWQFWLNIPLAAVGLALVWRALEGHDEPATEPRRIDWTGAAALTVGLVSLNLALLGNSEIQSISGLEELTGAGSGFDFRWLFVPAAAAIVFFVRHQRRIDHPLIDLDLFSSRNVRVALTVNAVVGAVLVIAMVDVPIFINAVEIDLERSAVVAGWVLAALTSAMALASYIGGRLTDRTWYRPPVVLGLGITAAAFVVMGSSWSPDVSYLTAAFHLAILGIGIGLVIAPTSAAVVDNAPPDDRGAAASMVMVARLVGLSVGLSALTAWGLARFERLRRGLDLPPITDDGFESALRAAQKQLTADAIGETFLASAAVVAVGVVISLAMRRTQPAPGVATDQTADLRVDQTGEAMQTWLNRYANYVIGALGVALLAAFVLIAVLFNRLDSTQEDLARVEAGSALFAGQVRGFQEQLVALEPAVQAGLDEAIAELDIFSSSTLEFSIAIDETVEIDAEVVIERNIIVPINETLPINETIDTTIRVDTRLGFEVPVDITVPVAVDVPIDLELDIPINETVPVQASVPVQLDVPITIDVADTELAVLAQSLSDGLASFRDVLSGFG